MSACVSLSLSDLYGSDRVEAVVHPRPIVEGNFLKVEVRAELAYPVRSEKKDHQLIPRVAPRGRRGHVLAGNA